MLDQRARRQPDGRSGRFPQRRPAFRSRRRAGPPSRRSRGRPKTRRCRTSRREIIRILQSTILYWEELSVAFIQGRIDMCKRLQCDLCRFKDILPSIALRWRTGTPTCFMESVEDYRCLLKQLREPQWWLQYRKITNARHIVIIGRALDQQVHAHYQHSKRRLYRSIILDRPVALSDLTKAPVPKRRRRRGGK